MRIDGDDWRNHAELARGLALSELPDVQEEALEEVRMAQRGAPRTQRVLQNIEAALLDGLGRSSEARRIHLEILKDSPEHAPTWHNVGLTYIADGRLAEARDAFERSVQLDTRRYRPHMWLAWLASGDASNLPRACADQGGVLAEWRSDPTMLEHLRAALLYGADEPNVLEEVASVAIRTGLTAQVAAILTELAQAREVDEATVRWTRKAAELRDYR